VKKIFLISLLVFASLFYGIYLSWYQFKIRLPGGEISASPYYDYRGITNVHSNASTGSGSYSDILKYAKAAKYDFIIFTEVNLPARPFFIEGSFQDMVVLVGGMYSYFDARLLYFGGESDTPPVGQSQTQVFFADLLSQAHSIDNGLVILAHPFYNRFSWKGDYPPGLDGVEILNLKSILAKTWKESKFKTLSSLFIYMFNPNLAFLNIYSNPSDELVLWDQLNRKHSVVGIAGNDTHAKVPLWGEKFIKFPSYEASFNLVSNHILTQTELTGDFKNDKNKILKALKSGQFYFALDLLGNPKGFYTEIRDDNRALPLGSHLKLKKNTKLIVEMPQGMQAPFQINVIKDGEVFFTSTSQKTSMSVSAPGHYRVEVRVNPKAPLPGISKWIPWIYTNNFYVE
jgi:hypothetical protein